MYRRDLRDTSLDGLLADAAAAEGVVQAVPVPERDAVAAAVEREGQIDLWLLDSEGGADAERLTSRGVLAMRYGRGDGQWFDPAPDGAAAAFVSADGDVATVDLDTGTVERVTTHDDPDLAVAWSPAGDDLAVVTDHFSRASLALADPEGGRLEAIADDEFLYADPWWDGDSVVAVRSTHRDLFDYEAALVRADRDDVETLFAEDAVRVQNPRPRPGGEEVAFVHDASGFDAVYATDGDDVRELAAVDGAEVADPAWRGDGDALAVTVTRGVRAHVHVLEDDLGPPGGSDAGGELTRVTDGDAFFTYPRFDGEELLAVGGSPGHPPAVQAVHDGDGPVDDDGPTPGRRVSPWTAAGLDDRIPDPETLTYDAGDREIEAVVYPPADGADEGSVPLLVKPHGGPTYFDRLGFDHRAAYFAALGYAVVLPNYRGSDGYGRAFRMANDRDWGGGDLDDVVAAADAVADAYDAVDGERAGVFGGSGGGLMTVNAVGRTDRFDAGAAFYGVYDYESFVDDTDDVGWQLMKRELGDLATDIENYRDASPIRQVEAIEAPLLVLHGEDDARVPISQSEQLVEQLEAHGKRHEFQRYDDEPHGFGGRETVVDAYNRVADLFAKYLRVDPDDGTSQPHTPE